jgi:hypothetical protein
VGGRRNLGALGDRYQLGYVYGAEAGYHWGALGVFWSALGGNFDSSRPDNPEAQLRLVEVQLGLRGRFYLGGEQLKSFLVVQGGGQILRTSIPVEPDASRNHLGPAVGGGVEFILSEELLVMLGSQYALVPMEPSAVTVFVSIGMGGQ